MVLIVSEQQEIVKVLQDALDQALTGRYNGVAVILADPKFKNNVMIAGHLPGLAIGAAYIHHAILRLMFPDDPKQQVSVMPTLQS